MDKFDKQSVPHLLLANANIITFNPTLPKAKWAAIGGDRIIDLGTSDNLNHYGLSKNKIIDCKGKTVLPGFIDSHLHLLSLAESFAILNLEPDCGIHSISDIKSKIIAFSRGIPKGTWIRGKGYNEFYLSEKRHPNRLDMDEAAPNHPVKLSHRSGHAHVLNSLALRMTGITEESPDPPGGIIDRDIESGKPTGLLYEMGNYLSSRIPPLENEQIERGIKMADKELISSGITSIQDASLRNDINRYNLFRTWKEKKMFNPRLNIMLGVESFNEIKSTDFSTHLNAQQVQINCIKIILDETTGELFPSQAELDELVFRIHKSGMQVAIHAIEENAVEAVCLAIEKALNRSPRWDHRHRIEHCSVCPPALAKRIAGLGIRVVTQPIFIYSSGDRYLGTVEDKKLKYLYPFGSLLKSGVIAAGSSDSPVAPLNPLLAVYAAVSRKSVSEKAIVDNENIQAIDGLRMYTIYGADVSFSEDIKGSISPGKLADLAVLSDDPLKLPPDELKDIKAEMTIIGGKIVWDRGI